MWSVSILFHNYNYPCANRNIADVIKCNFNHSPDVARSKGKTVLFTRLPVIAAY